MAAGGVKCTVFGFDCFLDWRPTIFLNAFPPTRVCSVCDLVPHAVGLLPCHHVLCPRCYNKCCEGRRCKCPLDKAVHEQQDLVWSMFTQESILERKIHCWNAGSGCNASGPASEIIEHFDGECKVHPVTCKRCGQLIVHDAMVEHVEAMNCTRNCSGSNSAPEGVLPFDFPVLETLQSWENRLEESTRLGLAAMESVRDAQTSLDRHVTDVTRTAAAQTTDLIGDLRTTLTSQSRESTQKILAACTKATTGINVLTKTYKSKTNETDKTLKTLKSCVERSMVQIKKQSDEMLTVVRDVSEAILQNKLTSSMPFEWTMDGWSEFKERADQEGFATCYAEKPEYFYGYLILPGTKIAEKNGVKCLCLAFKILEGIYDEILPWPLKKAFYFEVIHPTDKEKVAVHVVDTTYSSDLRELGMPTNSADNGLAATRGKEIQNLETNGYMKDDKILLKLEVLRHKRP
ncbi:TNF receptor-associated factor 6-B-like [Haemaphysalis longicornis]